MQKELHQCDVACERGADECRLTIEIRPARIALHEAADRGRVHLRVRIGASREKHLDQIHGIPSVGNRRGGVLRKVEIAHLDGSEERSALIKVVGGIHIGASFDQEHGEFDVIVHDGDRERPRSIR